MSRAVSVAALFLLCGCGPGPNDTPAAVTPVLAPTFRGVWYSDAEMRRIGDGEKNVRPTQNIELKVWEYTDPVGSPHPDVVEVVVQIRNPDAAPARGGHLVVREQWMVGGAAGESSASWENPMPERQLPEPVRLAPGGTATASVPIAVGDLVRRLASKDRYPWRLRVLIGLIDTSSGQRLADAQAELPIIPGD